MEKEGPDDSCCCNGQHQLSLADDFAAAAGHYRPALPAPCCHNVHNTPGRRVVHRSSKTEGRWAMPRSAHSTTATRHTAHAQSVPWRNAHIQLELLCTVYEKTAMFRSAHAQMALRRNAGEQWKALLNTAHALMVLPYIAHG